MRQQESRAALVRLYRHHVEKERVMLGVTYALRQVFLRFHPIDGITRDYDVVIDGGEIRKRKKKPSKQFRDEFGHTSLSIEEDIACGELRAMSQADVPGVTA
jgi:hypothetical protein